MSHGLALAGLHLLGFVLWAAAASPRFIGQEWDPATNRLRWAVPINGSCHVHRHRASAAVELGGVNAIRPRRPFRVLYFDVPPQLPQIGERLNCTVYVCSKEVPLGMKDGRIADERITASSYFRRRSDHGPLRARLDTQGVASAWCNDELTDPDQPWIQVEFDPIAYVTGLITQARGGDSSNGAYQRVTRYTVTHSRDGTTWHHVTSADGKPAEFSGNAIEGYDYLVTARFGTVLRTRFLRIHPTAWHFHCSMRFEVLGCYEQAT